MAETVSVEKPTQQMQILVTGQGFTSHSTQNRSFRRRSLSQSLSLVWKKHNLTQQKHTFTNQKKCTTTQKKHKKLPGLVASYDLAWKRRGPILVSATHEFVTYLLT